MIYIFFIYYCQDFIINISNRHLDNLLFLILISNKTKLVIFLDPIHDIATNHLVNLNFIRRFIFGFLFPKNHFSVVIQSP